MPLSVDLFPQIRKYKNFCKGRLWQIIQKSRKSVEIVSFKNSGKFNLKIYSQNVQEKIEFQQILNHI